MYDTVDLIKVSLPLRRPFRTVSHTAESRTLILVRMTSEGAVGWGEASPYPGHSPDDVDDAWQALCTAARSIQNGERPWLPPGTTANAAWEGASHTLTACQSGRSLAESIGGSKTSVPASASVGLMESTDALLVTLAEITDLGYRHVKLKVVPAMAAPLASVRREFPLLAIGLDANGSFTPGERSALLALDQLDLAFLEQPYPVGCEQQTAELAAELDMPIALDESLRTLTDVEKVLETTPVDIVTLKPARLGIGACVHAADLAAAAGKSARIGGMIESAVGRAIGAAIASTAPFTTFGDLSGSGWHFTRDVGSLDLAGESISTPTAPGIGVAIAVDEHMTVEHATYRSRRS